MNRKQWFVLGFGLILASLLFNSIKYGLSNAVECDEIFSDSSTELGRELGRASCTSRDFNATLVFDTLTILGTISVILGYLEPKKK